MNPAETLFPNLFSTQPNIVRQFLRAALRVDALEDLYREAKNSDCLPLSTSILKILRIKVQVADKDLQQIPRSGPVVFVANHPHGFLDGFVLDYVLSQMRPDLKLMVNEMIASVQGMEGRTIAVDVFGATNRQNIKAARESTAWLKARNSLLIFPAGEVSHWQPEEKRIADGLWSDFEIRCVRSTKATLVPIFIAGTNSLTFNLAGLLHAPLRTARLPVELLNKRESTVEVRIAKPIQPKEASQLPRDQAVEYVRARVYIMGYRGNAAPGRIKRLIQRPHFRKRPVCEPIAGLAGSILELQRNGKCLLENERYAVYADLGNNIPAVLHEIGRLREVTFRQAGEGTGKSIDLDEFDSTYAFDPLAQGDCVRCRILPACLDERHCPDWKCRRSLHGEAFPLCSRFSRAAGAGGGIGEVVYRQRTSARNHAAVYFVAGDRTLRCASAGFAGPVWSR